MREVIIYLWQLPQNLLGFLLLYVYEVLEKVDWFYEENGVLFVYVKGFSGGISMGRYVVLQDEWQHYLVDRHVKHEYGHCRQSRILGPLYLLVIGLPSLIHAAFFKEATPEYYKFYTERWADKLGGVKR